MLKANNKRDNSSAYRAPVYCRPYKHVLCRNNQYQSVSPPSPAYFPKVNEMDIRNVLVADAVDAACVALLQGHAIQVDCKYKLSKEQLIQVIQVSSTTSAKSCSNIAKERAEWSCLS